MTCVLGFSLTGCEDEAAAGSDAALLDVGVEQVASVTFIAAGRSANFTREGGSFAPGDGATSEFASQLELASERLFPLNGYRSLPGADLGDSMYALDPAGARPGRRAAECGGGCAMRVTTRSGTGWEVVIGGRSFNDAGFYAVVTGRPTLYLVIAQTVGDIITFATTKPFQFPPTARATGVDKAIDALGNDQRGSEDPDAGRHPFLRQALAAEADRRASAAGRPGGQLVRAATSTRDQAGARPEKTGEK